jgi:septal ring factor EnvC (AmiA/AmiB activator)
MFTDLLNSVQRDIEQVKALYMHIPDNQQGMPDHLQNVSLHVEALITKLRQSQADLIEEAKPWTAEGGRRISRRRSRRRR